MSVHNTSNWSLELISQYKDDILAAFAKLAKRFPADVTVESLFRDAVTGNKALWLVLDDENRFQSLAMTQIATNEATGQKFAKVMDLAGKDHRVWSDELNKALEDWGREHGADWFAIEGRPGWGRVAEQYGYKPYAVMWRKKVE